MPPTHDVISYLERLAPLQLAEQWDNVGLLLGDRSRSVSRVMTCLTLTEDVAEEAIADGADMIICHHPILFRAVKRLTSDHAEGRLILRLAEARVLVYSPHTAFDSARDGINAQIAESLQLEEVRPLRPSAMEPDGSVGGGRCGTLPRAVPLRELVSEARKILRAEAAQVAGGLDRAVQRVAIACGSAAEFLPDAVRAGCDVLLTGEARFHACLEARDGPCALVLLGHYATERPAVEQLARVLGGAFPDVTCWPSRVEKDPVIWMA